VRERIRTLTHEIKHPRDDVATLKQRVDNVTGTLRELRAELGRVAESTRRAQSTLTDDIAHARQVLTADLARVRETQDADRSAARARADDLGRRIDQMVRQIEATLDGISDHQDLLTGLRALVRMIKPDPASS
jgi:chromosome segregation ATPase